MMGAEAARLAAMPEEELPILEALAAVATLAQPAAELR
jgi:hypothetical protein